MQLATPERIDTILGFARRVLPLDGRPAQPDGPQPEHGHQDIGSLGSRPLAT
jgi:hypothetical protein